MLALTAIVRIMRRFELRVANFAVIVHDDAIA